MADARAWLSKAEESLAGAEAEAKERRYDNAANRLYFACFLAAVAALTYAEINPRRSVWRHDTVQAEFQGVLIHQRHVYHRSLRGFLAELEALRLRADYSSQPVSGRAVQAVLRRARSLVEQVKGVIEG